jgi:hypothetical protein
MKKLSPAQLRVMNALVMYEWRLLSPRDARVAGRLCTAFFPQGPVYAERSDHPARERKQYRLTEEGVLRILWESGL